MAKKTKKEEVAEVSKVVKDKFDLNAVDENGQPYNQRCVKCLQVFPLREFYAAPTTISTNGRLNICKACVQKMSVSKYGKFTPTSVYNACRELNRPFIMSEYKKANDQKIPDAAKMGEYMRLIAMKSKIDMLFADGETPTESKNSKSTGKALDKDTQEMCEELFGFGLKDDEYSWAYKLYSDLLNNYPLKTKMHQQKLADWAKTQMKADFALASDDVTSAEKWAKLAESKATAAKINPSQLSAADLSDGISSFSKIAEAVEKAQDIVPMLPSYREKPRDKVDYTIWQIVNYCRKMEGKPEADYKDVYAFMDSQYEKQKEMLPFLKKEENGHYDDEQKATEEEE